MRLFRQLSAEIFGLDIIDRMNREIVALARANLTRQFADDPLPLPLCYFVLAHPKALGQCHIDLRLIETPLGFVGRTSHPEPAWRRPAKLDACDSALVSRF